MRPLRSGRRMIAPAPSRTEGVRGSRGQERLDHRSDQADRSAVGGQSPPRWRPTRGWLVVVAIIIVGLAGGTWLLGVQPLAEGSTSGPDSTRGFLRAEADPFGSERLYLYCDPPGGLVAWYVSITDISPLAITLLGAARSDMASAPAETNWTWLESVAAARRPPAPMPPLANGPTTDPFHEPDLRPTTIQPGQEVELWARYRRGGLAVPTGGATTIFRSLSLRISILGLERDVEVPLRDGIGLRDPPCGS